MRPARSLLILPLLSTMFACSSSPDAGLRPVNAGLDALAREDGDAHTPAEGDSTDPWARAASDLQTLLNDGTESANRAPSTPIPQDTLASPSTSISHPVGERADNLAAPPLTDVEPPLSHDEDAPSGQSLATLAIPAPTPASLAERLHALLMERASSSSSPLSDAARAAIVEGALGIPSDAEIASLNLHESERARLDALRDLAASLTQEDLSSDDVLAELERLSAELSSSLHAFRLREAAICVEVRGFGDYESMDRPILLVGNSHRLLVYTEPDRFGTREKSVGGTTMHEVEISQELTLYHDAPGDLQVWHHPRERIQELSRRPKRDFYLVHEIEFPRRLSVGSYLLRVSARDEVTGTNAERTIPIRVVADPSLLEPR